MASNAAGERLGVLQDWLTGHVLGVAWASSDPGDTQGALRLRRPDGAELTGLRVDQEELPDGTLLLRLDGSALGEPSPAHRATFLEELEGIIAARQSSTADKSYTKSLLEKGAAKIGEKLREEADELARALADEADERVTSEAADVVYHLLVGLRLRARTWREVAATLAARTGRSGHEEKASRTKP